MKARTKFQKQVVESAKKLSPLTPYQEIQVFKKVIPHIAKLKGKKYYTCLDCGHTWDDKELHQDQTITCPCCGTRLRVDSSRKKVFKINNVFNIVTTCAGLQVVRTFYVFGQVRLGKSPEYIIHEAFQYWIDEDGAHEVIGRARQWMGHYTDSWNWNSPMNLRSENNGHSVYSDIIIGQIKVIDKVKRNGFKNSFYERSPKSVIVALLADNRAETLVKTGQIPLFKYLINSQYCNYWAQIKIALKHKYFVADAALWVDMLKAIDYCHKDIRNPKNILPDDLLKAHDYWMNKRANKERKEQEERDRRARLDREQKYLENLKLVKKEEEQYNQAKHQFFDINLIDKEISVTPLKSVKEFLDEGHLHHHCVFTNKYYQKEKSLILHALIDNVSVATIELNLDTLSIVQCRTTHNQKSIYHDRIISLIKNNMGKIASKIKSNNKQKEIA